MKEIRNNRHTHLTRDIKPLGQCPSCDEYHNRHIPKNNEREFKVCYLTPDGKLVFGLQMPNDRELTSCPQYVEVEALDWLVEDCRAFRENYLAQVEVIETARREFSIFKEASNKEIERLASINLSQSNLITGQGIRDMSQLEEIAELKSEMTNSGKFAQDQENKIEALKLKVAKLMEKRWMLEAAIADISTMVKCHISSRDDGDVRSALFEINELVERNIKNAGGITIYTGKADYYKDSITTAFEVE